MIDWQRNFIQNIKKEAAHYLKYGIIIIKTEHEIKSAHAEPSR
jgi:hypothetical protein